MKIRNSLSRLLTAAVSDDDRVVDGVGQVRQFFNAKSMVLAIAIAVPTSGVAEWNVMAGPGLASPPGGEVVLSDQKVIASLPNAAAFEVERRVSPAVRSKSPSVEMESVEGSLLIQGVFGLIGF